MLFYCFLCSSTKTFFSTSVQLARAVCETTCECAGCETAICESICASPCAITCEGVFCVGALVGVP